MDTKPLPLWAKAPHTVTQMLLNAVQTHSDRCYLKTAYLSLSYAQTDHVIAQVADMLGPEARGRDVVLVLPNSAAFVAVYFGALFAGARPALVNHGHPEATIRELIGTLDNAAVFSDRSFPDLNVTTMDDTVVRQMAQTPQRHKLTPVGDSQDISAILFSGGTTGLPKQVPHSHRALMAKVERIEWGWSTNDGEIWLPVAPFTHVYGFLMGVLNPILRAGRVVIPGRFQPDLIVDLLRDEKITIFGGGPPAIYQAVLASPKFSSARFPSLRVCPGGGAPFPLDLHNRWQAATGLPIAEGYGMNEIAPIAINTHTDGMKPGAAGKAVPDTVIEIVDTQTGEVVLPEDETGEIRVKGPHMMRGYTANQSETDLALRHGFVYTGDIGRLDRDGFLTITDRKKDVILVKGFNVFPREVEETFIAHPAVVQACVVKRQDPRAGEVPVAFIVLGNQSNHDAIEHYAQTHLTELQAPRPNLPSGGTTAHPCRQNRPHRPAPAC